MDGVADPSLTPIMYIDSVPLFDVSSRCSVLPCLRYSSSLGYGVCAASC